MNEQTRVDIERAVELAKQGLRTAKLSQPDIAVAILDDSEYSNEWFWRDPDGNWLAELVAAEGEVAAGTFVTNVVVDPEEPLQFHAPTWMDSEFETEMLFVLHWSLTDGMELARCYFTREGGPTLTELEFSTVEAYTGQAVLTDETPGFDLMRRLLPA